MVTSCPVESDPRLHVRDFVTDPSVRTIAGLRSEGIGPLMDVVIGELSASGRVIVIDDGTIADNGICFSGELAAFVRKEMDSSGSRVIVVRDVIPVNEWQKGLDFVKDAGGQVFFSASACRQVPICCKLF